MTFCHGEVGIPGVLKHGMLTGPVDEIWQHREKIRARHGQRELNMREHQTTEVGYGTCLNET